LFPRRLVDVFGWQTVAAAGAASRKKQLVITDTVVNAMAVYQETGVPALALNTTTHLLQEVLSILVLL